VAVNELMRLVAELERLAREAYEAKLTQMQLAKYGVGSEPRR
jgi:hypothetical protein